MTRLAAKARQIVRRDFVIDISYRVTFALEIFDSVVMLAAYAFLARAVGNARPDGYAPLDFLIVGIAMSGAATTALVCFAYGVRGLQIAGTIKAVMATPTPPAVYLLLSSIYPLMRAVADAILLFLIGGLLGAGFGRANWVGAAVVIALALFSMAAFGILAAAFALVFKRGNPMTWLLGSATWLLSGVLYPTSVLPRVLGELAWLLPTTHALTALRAVVLSGATLTAVRDDATFLLVFAVAGLPASLWVFDRAVDYARRTGTLGQL